MIVLVKRKSDGPRRVALACLACAVLLVWLG